MNKILIQYYPEIIIFCSILLSLIFSLIKTKIEDLMNFVLSIGLFLFTMLLVFKGKIFIHSDYILIKEPFTYYFKFITLFCFIVITIMLRKGLSDFEIEIHELPVFLLSILLGSFLLISGNNFALIFLSLELLSLSTYIMCAMSPAVQNSTEAAIKYLILGAISTSFFAFGTAMLYGASGTLSFYEIEITIKAQTEIPILFELGCIFILISLLIKMSAAPFHVWLPDIFQGSPLAIVTFIGTIPKIAALAILIRLLYGPFEPLHQDWKTIIGICGLLSVGWGTFSALHQTNLKRLLAYSSIAHIGFIILPLINQNIRGLQASLSYFTFYILTLLSIFGIILWFKRLGHTITNIKDLAIVNRYHPNITTLLSLLFIALSGIPPFSGFFVKLHVITSFFENKESGLSILICCYLLLMSVISAYYYLNIIKEIYFNNLPHAIITKQTPVNDFLNKTTIIFISLITIAFFWLPIISEIREDLIAKALSSLIRL